MPIKYGFVDDLMENKDALDVEKACSFLKIPQLIIHGEEDETISKNSALNLKERNPKAQLEIIEGANHTFGSKHPFQEDHLPKEMKLASDIIVKFFKFSS